MSMLLRFPKENEAIIHEHELMTEQGAQKRLNDPGEQIRGALTEDQRERPIVGPQGRAFVTDKPTEVRAPKTGAARAILSGHWRSAGSLSLLLRELVRAVPWALIPDNTTQVDGAEPSQPEPLREHFRAPQPLARDFLERLALLQGHPHP